MRKILLGSFLLAVLTAVLGLSLHGSDVMPTAEPKVKKFVPATMSKQLQSVPVSDKGIVFTVDSVELNKTPLRDTAFALVLEDMFEQKPLVHAQVPGEVRPVNGNGFASAVYYAFTYHYPLVITPDDIWLLICQGLANHINSNPEKYEGFVVNRSRPQTIIVRNDSLPLLASKDWEKFIAQFEAETKLYVKREVNNFLVKEFSTTTPQIKTVYKATVLETLKSYFDYYGMSGCGIPYIRLKGTVADWEKIYASVDELNQYGLDFWTKELKPVLKEFVEASKGKANRKFWQSIYKDTHLYGISYLSGWIIKLYPYLENTTYKNASDTAVMAHPGFKRNRYLKGNDYLFSEISHGDLPKGYTKIDITWENFFSKTPEKKKLQLRAGFMALQQDKNNMEIGTCISWAFMDPSARGESLAMYDYQELVHKNDFHFSPEIVDTALVWPVYHPKKNKDYTTGMAELKKYLETKLAGNTAYAAQKGKILLRFIVTWKGTVERVQVTTNDKVLGTTLEKTLQNLPYTWTPCQPKMSNIPMPGIDPENPGLCYGNIRLKMKI